MRRLFHFFPPRDEFPAIADYAANFQKAINPVLKGSWEIVPIETGEFGGFTQKPANDDIIHFEFSHLDREMFELAYKVIHYKSPVIITLHDIPDTVKSPSKIVLKNHFWLRFNRIRYFLDDYYSDKVLKKASLIIGLTEIGVEEFSKSIYKKIKTPVSYLPYVQTGEIEINDKSLSLWENKTLGYIGYPSVVKGYDVLVKACYELFQQSRYDDWKLVLGCYPEHIEKFVIENDGEKEWKAMMANKRIRLVEFAHDYIKELSKLSLMITPYKWTIKRAASSVLNHAWAMGLPVIATRTNGFVTDIRNGDNGVLIEPDNVNELTTTMDKILSDKKLFQNLSLRGKETILKERSYEVVGQRYCQLLSDFFG